MNSSSTNSACSGSTAGVFAISTVSCSIMSLERCLKISAAPSLPSETQRIAAFLRPDTLRAVVLLAHPLRHLHRDLVRAAACTISSAVACIALRRAPSASSLRGGPAAARARRSAWPAGSRAASFGSGTTGSPSRRFRLRRTRNRNTSARDRRARRLGHARAGSPSTASGRRRRRRGGRRLGERQRGDVQRVAARRVDARPCSRPRS